MSHTEKNSVEKEHIPEKKHDNVLNSDNAPTKPGCYIMRDASGNVLYVGKARNLRARLRNYINETDSRYSVKFLMRRVASVDFLVVDSEKDALLLENTLIKRHKPRYNVRLRDDKNYISIRLNPNESFPRLTVVRRHKNDGARYFGPYHDTRAARKTLKEIQRLTPLRICSDHIMHNRTRPCIYYQIKQCLAPCVGLVTEASYRDLVRQVLLLLEGRTREFEGELRLRIQQLADNLQFEEAAVLRDRLSDLQSTLQPQHTIVQQGAGDKDVFGIYREGHYAEVQLLYYRNNAMIGGKSFSFDRLETPLEELFSSFLLQYYSNAPYIPVEVLVPLEVEGQSALADILSEKREKKVHVHYPQRGSLVKLVQLANSNAQNAFIEKRGKEKARQNALENIRNFLQLQAVPGRIECFDISTIQGDKTVAAMVVFEDGMPVKKRYRRYEIRTNEGQDDFAAMREVLRRRYTRAIAEEDLPDLVLIDGGKGHLNVALAILQELELDQLPCAGIAKARTESKSTSPHERFFVPGRMNPIIPHHQNPGLLLLARIRDETHRFAITYHRLKRNKATLNSTLLSLPGVGPSRARALLAHFGSLTRIRAAEAKQLAAVPGISDKLATEIVSALKLKK